MLVKGPEQGLDHLKAHRIRSMQHFEALHVSVARIRSWRSSDLLSVDVMHMVFHSSSR